MEKMRIILSGTWIALMLTYLFDDSGCPSFQAGSLRDMATRVLCEYSYSSSVMWRPSETVATEYDVWNSTPPLTRPIWAATGSLFGPGRPSEPTPTLGTWRSTLVRSSTREWRR